MNKELFLALLAALLGVCLQIMPTVFEVESGVANEELKVVLTQTEGRYHHERSFSLKEGEKKTAELPRENLDDIVVMSAGFPRNTTHNERDRFAIAGRLGTPECSSTSTVTYCSYKRPDLIGKTKFKITAIPDNHYQVQALD